MAALVKSAEALERVVMVVRTVRRSADEAMVRQRVVTDDRWRPAAALWMTLVVMEKEGNENHP